MVAVGEAKKPAELCKTKKNEHWGNDQRQKTKKQTTEFVWHFAIWKIGPFMLHGICRILQTIFAAFMNFNLPFAWQLSFWLIIEALWNLNLSPAHLHHCFYSTQKTPKGKKRKHATAKETQEYPQQPEKTSCQTCNEWSMFIARPFLL